MAQEKSAIGDEGRVPLLDLLRLAAILGVICFHYGFLGPTAVGSNVALPGLGAFARYGFLGVPAFFVISGFVIAYSAQGRTSMSFAIARAARIYPGFVCCMTLSCMVTLLIGAPGFTTSFAQWAANLFVAAPAFRQPYMDIVYWSLVIEITFYGWVALLIAANWFPRRIDAIVMVWLGISMANELTIDAKWVESIFLADYSGFFATGLIIYEFHRGRRDALLVALFGLATGVAVFQGVHNLAWLRYHTGDSFDSWVAASICLASIAAIFCATRVRTLPLPAGLVLAAGGVTYPLYLLHQQIGYVVFKRFEDAGHPALLVVLILLAIVFLSWAVWRYVERPCQRILKRVLTGFVAQVRDAPPRRAPQR